MKNLLAITITLLPSAVLAEQFTPQQMLDVMTKSPSNRDTYGLDVGYFITPEINASVGYYYQQGDDGAGNSSGVKGRLAFAVADDVEFGGTYTYDDAFNARASADLTIRFGGGSHKEKSKQQAKAEEQPQIKELSATPGNRDVRVHDPIPAVVVAIGKGLAKIGGRQVASRTAKNMLKKEVKSRVKDGVDEIFDTAGQE